MDDLFNIFGGAEQLWNTICQYAEKAGRATTKLILELYFVMKSPDTPMIDKTLIVVALGYQLLPEDMMSKEKYGWLGLLDNGAALYLAYNRVKTRVTPEIETRVDTILNQWFGSSPEQDDPSLESGTNEEEPQLINVPDNLEPAYHPNIYNTPTNRNEDDDDVVID